MDPKKFYDELIDSIDDYELRTAARILSYHVGEQNAVPLEELSAKVLESSSETAQRKMREILKQLVDKHGMPICSNSGKAGRWLAGTHEEITETVRELESRIEQLSTRVRQLKMAKLPAKLPKIGVDKQPGLF